jgi:hypothetical protein
MRLYDASRMGDTQTVTDAYGSASFLAQFEPMSYTKIDGVNIQKRSISVAPTVSLPARGCLSIDGQVYLFGKTAPDYWKGSVIRRNVIIQGATGLATINSVAGELAGTLPVSAYAALAFSKYMPEANDNSRYPPQYQVFFSGTESVPSDSVIHLDNKWYLTKQSYLSTSGLRVALANELDGVVFDEVPYSTVTYNPLTDTSSSVVTTVKVFRVKWSEHFTYLSTGTTTYERGDQQVLILKATVAKPSDKITLSDGVWRVLSVQDEGLVWSCHVRRV